MAISNKKTLLNSSTSVLQGIVTGIVYFFLYKYLLKVVGAEKLGLWSLIIASTSIANLGNLGVTGSVVKFVANRLALKDYRGVNMVIWTSLVSMMILMLVICVILFFLAKFFLSLSISPDLLPEALDILPWALLSLFINALGSVFLSALDGMELIYYRSFIYMSTAVIFLITCYFLVPNFGLKGIVFAQLLQSLIVLFITPVILLQRLKGFSLLRWHLSKQTFIELFKYGLNFQVIGISSLLFEPISKFCISSYGNLHMVAYFEMASRLITQIRSLVVSATQVIVPTVAKQSTLNRYNIQVEYLKLYKLVVLFTVAVFTSLIVIAPAISYIWIGGHQNSFLYFIFFLAIGWSFNIFSTPAYFMNLGLGTLKWNVYSHILLAVSNLSLGILLGILWGGLGVVLAVAISLVLSSVLLLFNFNKIHNISGRQISTNDWRTITLLMTAAIASTVFYFLNANSSHLPLLLATVCFLFLIVLLVSFIFNTSIMSFVVMLRSGSLKFK